MNEFFFLANTDQREVELGDNMQIGRSIDSDLVLTEGHPSRNHARLWVEAGQVWLEDLDSANGTYINEQALNQPQILRPGDKIRFDIEGYELGQRNDDAQATVVRPADPDATVLRAEPTPAATASPDVTPTPTVSPPATPLPVVAAATPLPPPIVAAAPKSWQAGAADDGMGTRPLSVEELAEIRAIQANASIEVGDQPILHVRTGSRSGDAIILEGENREWLIGSDGKTDLTFTDENVSMEQAILSVQKGRWKITDQFSKNRTYVNGKQTNISYLNSGDSIAFGGVQCVLALPQTSQQRSVKMAVSKKSTMGLWRIASIGFGFTTLAMLALAWWLRG